MVCPRRACGSATHGLRAVLIELALGRVGTLWQPSVRRRPSVSKTVGRRAVRVVVRPQLWLLPYSRARSVDVLFNRPRIGRDVGGVCACHARAPSSLQRRIQATLRSLLTPPMLLLLLLLC